MGDERKWNAERDVGRLDGDDGTSLINDFLEGVVLEQNRINALRPKVMVMLNPDHKPLQPRKILDMQKLPAKASSTGAMCIARGHEHGAFGIDPMNCFK